MNLKAYGFLLIASLLWAGNMVAGKLAVGHITPAMLSAARWVLAAGIIFAVSIKPLKRDWPVIKRNLPLLLAYGFFGFAAFNIVLYTALEHTTAINVVIEDAGIPLVIMLVNFALFRVKASWAQIAGFLVTLIGVGLTATHGDLSRIAQLDLNIGDALMLLAVLIYGVYTVTLKYKPDIHWQSLMAVPTLGALMAAIPYLLWMSRDTGIVWPDATGWWIVLYCGLLPSLVSQVTYIRGVELIGPNRAGLFINTIPLFGVVLSVLIPREPLHGFHFAALGLIVAGIVFAEWGRPKASLA
ncbi:DMT family transporter [Asticcacaulis sp. YBE204]|uniref:DMT family transporter n=1 Tax=Asticcacaulis sp. YBE204 TaxID=1282363 RepID=UPI0003C3AC14|nr:DMT family transporter [Asticcacaulis sp. YBE204]ESQ78062.1 membrane protein [Asticcacaulis sp. YBE204]